MGKQTVEVLVEGGKASAGPPIGTQLGPLGVNVKAIVDAINEKTGSLKGIKVPVKIEVDSDTKEFEISIGTPPVAALIKKELGLDKASGKSGTERVGDLSVEQAKSIAKTKFGSDDQSFVNQIIGTCRSMGITVGQGEVTEEEKQAYEAANKAAEAAAAEAKAAKDAAAAKPAEGAAVTDKSSKPAEKAEKKGK